MSERRAFVNLRLDASPYVEALSRAAASLAELYPKVRAVTHRLRHHRPEKPAISAMHADYDRRRRARRRKR